MNTSDVVCLITFLLLLFSVGYIIVGKEKFTNDVEQITSLTASDILEPTDSQKHEFWYLTIKQVSKLPEDKKKAFIKAYLL